jgi:adenylate cyclase
MNWLRLLPNIRYGTEGYPEKVARRLRAVNIAAWLAALVPGYFAAVRFLNPERWEWGIVNALFAIGIAAIPLLHRFGPLVAPLVLCAIAYAHLFRIDYDAGTGFGGHVGYLTAAALGMVLLGIERIWLATSLAATAAGRIVLLHIIVPNDTGLVSAAGIFANFAINVAMSTFMLIAHKNEEIAEHAAAKKVEPMTTSS